MIKDALYAVTHGQDLSYDLAKDTMNNPATIMLENPVFAPTEIPDNDSK